MCVNLQYQAVLQSQTYTGSDEGTTLPLKGYFNIKIENEGDVDALLFNNSVRVKPGIPFCLGIENVQFGQDTVLRFAPDTGDKLIRITKYSLQDKESGCTI